MARKVVSSQRKVRHTRPMSAKIVLEQTDEVYPTYINHAEISQNRHEFCISLARLPSKFASAMLKEIQETGEIHVPVLAQLLMPPTLGRVVI